MLLGEMTDVNITSAPVFRVTARNVILECRATDSGQRVRLYVTHPALMMYFIRFCDVATRHHVMGSLNVTAFTFDDANRAFVSIRLSVDGIRPLPNVDEEGNIIPTLTRRMRVRDFDRGQEFMKLKYIVYKYVWENFTNDRMVVGRNLNAEVFALQVSDLYEDLVARHLAPRDYNPVNSNESVSRPRTSASGRPAPRVTRITYTYNDAVRRTDDWDHPSLLFATLANDSLPFDESLFIVPDRE